MVAGTGSGFGSATGFVEADSALRGASPKGMRGELFITCLLGDFLSKIPGQFVPGSTSLTAHGLSQTALTEPLKMTRGGVSAKMKNKNTWSIPDIAALADYFGVPVMSLLDDTLMHQMLGERNLGASLVAATTARFPVRAAEGQADGLKPLETKDSEPRYLVEPGAGEYPQRGGYGPMEHGPKSIAPKACLYLFTNCEVNNTNGFRFLPVDMRAVLLLVVIFMRLAAETACNE